MNNGRIESICFITPEYPIEGDMTNTFIDALICEIARQGVQCTVIAPFDVFRYIRYQGKKRPRFRKKMVNEKISIDIYSPPYYAFLGHVGISNISQNIYNKIVLNEFKRIAKIKKFDAVYGHFFRTGGLAAELIERKYGIPSFVACGESSLKKLYGHEKSDKFIRCIEGVTGIVCVSTKNKNEILDVWGQRIKNINKIKNKMGIFPNGFFPGEFSRMDKNKIRNDLGFNQDEFIISFLGRFQEHKGIRILAEALKHFDDIGSIFLGQGSLIPDCTNIRFLGQIDHGDVAKYLNASDVFILPTRAEGCSNAIVEALACGLPIISSDLDFNYDILNEHNSILIDPTSIDELTKAILYLKENKKELLKLGKGAENSAKELTIDCRARKILKFMAEMITL